MIDTIIRALFELFIVEMISLIVSDTPEARKSTFTRIVVISFCGIIVIVIAFLMAKYL